MSFLSVINDDVHVLVRLLQSLSVLFDFVVDLVCDLIDLAHDIFSQVELLLALVYDLLLKVNFGLQLNRSGRNLRLRCRVFQVVLERVPLHHFLVHLLAFFDFLNDVLELFYPVHELSLEHLVLLVPIGLLRLLEHRIDLPP